MVPSLLYLLALTLLFDLSTMLARTALRPALVAQPMIAASQARNMATLREIELRLKSVKNIEKITKVCFGLSKSIRRNG